MRRVVIPPIISGDLPPLDTIPFHLHGVTMGTTWSVRLATARSTNQEALRQLVQKRLDRIVEEMSHWEPSSNLERVNRAPAGTWHVLPEDFFHVLAYGMSIAEESGGACNPAAGALVNIWGFGSSDRHDQPGFSFPSEETLDTALSHSDWRTLKLDHETRSVWQPGGVLLDLSAIAKGYAVDAVAHELEKRGFVHYLIEVGGELRGAGMKPDGQPWWVSLEQPATGETAREKQQEIVVALHGLAVATSGDYRKYFSSNGKVFPHTIDPRNGRPIDNGVASVTVLHEKCMEADALSTALTVLGVDEGMHFAEKRHIAARFLVRTVDESGQFNEYLTSAFKEMLE